MNEQFKLRKAKFLGELEGSWHLVEDVLNGDLIKMSLPRRFRNNSFEPKPGEFVYVMVSPYELNRGRYFSAKHDFRTDYYNDLMNQKDILDKLHKKD